VEGRSGRVAVRARAMLSVERFRRITFGRFLRWKPWDALVSPVPIPSTTPQGWRIPGTTVTTTRLLHDVTSRFRYVCYLIPVFLRAPPRQGTEASAVPFEAGNSILLAAPRDPSPGAPTSYSCARRAGQYAREAMFPS
jgi:hypothetical protein